MPDETNIATDKAQHDIINDAGPDYTILEADDCSTICSQVNQLLRRGWEPCGGVAVTVMRGENPGEDTEIWAQAMIKRG